MTDQEGAACDEPSVRACVVGERDPPRLHEVVSERHRRPRCRHRDAVAERDRRADDLGVVTVHDPARDEEARRTLQELFPTREVIGIDCTDLVWGLGAFHCVSQQWPAVEE